MSLSQPFSGTLESDFQLLSNRIAELRKRIFDFPLEAIRAATRHPEVATLFEQGLAARRAFLRMHVRDIYAEVTGGHRREPRLAELLSATAERFPALLPTAEQMAAEAARPQREKLGLEIDYGILLSAVLNDRPSGLHLIRSMSRPRADSLHRLAEFRRHGTAELGPVSVTRDGRVGLVTFQNHRYLNAEDDDTVAALETAVDLVLLDDRIEVGVLRGGPATHSKWAGRRVFGSGINLTHLYNGRISLTGFFLDRELGALNKIYRGHPVADDDALDDSGARHEKPWIAALDSFAIGGGCQMLLVVDRIVAEQGAYFNLPASREGIVPGCGALRLPRFVGEGLAHQALYSNRDFAVDSPEGRMLVSDVVAASEMDEALRQAVAELLRCGSRSVRANRRALRTASEPIDDFRRFLADYALTQAHCAHGPELISNLESTWGRKLTAQTRRAMP